MPAGLRSLLVDTAQALRSLQPPPQPLEEPSPVHSRAQAKGCRDISKDQVQVPAAVDFAAEDTPTQEFALLDSGATHVVRTQGAEDHPTSSLVVSLAGDAGQKTWPQTAGGSLLISERTQTILPVGKLVRVLGCHLRWNRRGLSLTHPRLGLLRTSVQNGCPVVAENQAQLLVKELEEAAEREHKDSARALQSRIASLKSAPRQPVSALIQATAATGDADQLLQLLLSIPGLSQLSAAGFAGLIAKVPISPKEEWEALKGLPLPRRARKTLKKAPRWILRITTGEGLGGRGDPLAFWDRKHQAPVLHVDLDFPERWHCAWPVLVAAALRGRLCAVQHDGAPDWHLRAFVLWVLASLSGKEAVPVISRIPAGRVQAWELLCAMGRSFRKGSTGCREGPHSCQQC